MTTPTRVRITCPHPGHNHYGLWASINNPGCELDPATICKLIDRAYRTETTS